MAPRRRAVTATDLDTLADRFRVDMIHIFMVLLILKKRLYFHGFNFIPKNNVMGNVLEKKLIETGLIRYQLLLFLISSMCEKLASFQEYGYIVIKMNTTFINK